MPEPRTHWDDDATQEIKAHDAVNEAVEQVAFADRILLNKTDLVSAEELAAVREELQSINAFAEIIESVQSVVDLDRILGVSSFSVEQTLEVDPTFLRDAPTPSFFKKGGLRSSSAVGAEEASKKRPPPRKRHDLSGAHTHHARTHARQRCCMEQPCAHECTHAHHSSSRPCVPPPGVSSVGVEVEGNLDFNVLNGAWPPRRARHHNRFRLTVVAAAAAGAASWLTPNRRVLQAT
jgi:G3E family GTPase